MRHSTILILLVVVLTICSTAAAAEPWPTSARGFGVTVEGARKHALKEAVRLITEYLHNLDPPLREWQVTEEFVEKNLVAGAGVQGADVPGANGETFKSWILPLKPANIDQFTQLDRQALSTRRLAERKIVAHDRLLVAGIVSGAALTFLMLAMAYGRLAEKKARQSGGALNRQR